MEKLIVNCETNEAQVVPMTAEEVATYKAIAVANAQELQTKETARLEILAKLGITQEEASLLLS